MGGHMKEALDYCSYLKSDAQKDPLRTLWHQTELSKCSFDWVWRTVEPLGLKPDVMKHSLRLNVKTMQLTCNYVFGKSVLQKNRRQQEGDSSEGGGAAVSWSFGEAAPLEAVSVSNWSHCKVRRERWVDKQVWLTETSMLLVLPQPLYPVFRIRYESLGSSLSVCQM